MNCRLFSQHENYTTKHHIVKLIYDINILAIIQNNNIQSVTIVRMEVPCCGGLEMAAKKALQNSGKFIPWQVVTISIDGKIIN